MNVIRRAVLLAALAAGPARGADFEGIADGRITGASMSWTYRAAVGKDGVRAEVEMALPEKQAQAMGTKTIRRVTIQRRAEPDLIYTLDETQRTYTVIDMRKVRESMKDAPQRKYTVRRLGRDRVAGFSCEKVALKRADGVESEMCVTSEISSKGSWARSLVHDQTGGGVFKALREAGVEGFPIRWRMEGERGPTTMELVSAHRQGVPASTFAIPAGYQEAKGHGAPGEAAQRRMERMTPEQRKKLEEALRGVGGR
jgi:hypothetical protein